MGNQKILITRMIGGGKVIFKYKQPKILHCMEFPKCIA